MANSSGRRNLKKEQTRRLILKCASALFHKRGFAATTLEDIAAEAGIHKQTVLRYFKSKEGIALAFRQVALERFKQGLQDPSRELPVLEYWRNFIETSAREVSERGDMIRFHRLTESEPALLASSLAIHLEYEELLANELSREAGLAPESDLYSRLLAAFLVAGNFAVARYQLHRGGFQQYVDLALNVVNFAINHFPPRTAQPALSAIGHENGRAAAQSVTQ
jgi:AcrR family transcriptional regulator